MSSVDVREAIEALQRAEVVALPTETVYGLAGRIDSESVLHRIFAVKQRPFFDPLIVHISELSAAHPLCSSWPSLYERLAQEFWPGPLTLIAPKSSLISPLITSGLETVAVRCPAHPLMLQVLREVGIPLAAPSANRFGRTSPTTAAHVEAEFSGQVPVLDGGSCAIGLESTVLQAAEQGGEWWIQVLRPGGLSRPALRAFLDREGIRYRLTREDSAASPGHLKAHYQPVSPVILLRDQIWSDEVKANVECNLGRTLKSAREVSLPSAPQEAARRLYELFRVLSTDADQALWIRRKPEQEGEDWEALWDRVERAAALKL